MQETNEGKERQAQHIVTSENRSEFMAKRLDLTVPIAEVEPEPVEEKEVKDEDSSDESEKNEAKKDEKRKGNSKLQERFSELTSARDAARAEAKAEREKREKAEKEVDELRSKIKPKESNGKPDPEDPKFNGDWKLYAEALSEWKVETALKERDEREALEKEKAERDKVVREWSKRIQEFMNEAEDYTEVLSSSDVVVSDEVRDAIVESEMGPQVLYYLAKNPEEAERLIQLNTRSALRELGKIESRLEAENNSSEEEVEEIPKKVEKKETRKMSKAPEPLSPIKGSGTTVDVPFDSNGEFKGTPKQWRTLRKAGKIK